MTSTRERRDGRLGFLGMLALDVALPLALFYGLRAAGVGPWWALLIGGLPALIRLAVGVVRRRRVDRMSMFGFSVLVAGTVMGLITADTRLLLARESLVTVVVGVWILTTVGARRPVLFTATERMMPPAAAVEWHRSWDTDARFRRMLTVMTVAFGLAFLLDAAARVVMAYTLPADVVPIASAGLLVVMLIGIVQTGKVYARRRLLSSSASSPR
ncbi:VC0807 family protein [Tersicoccus sp. Bi-70]|uniref:VC0807 family protein n=1 Tax=Tersicoccus sp. Bi-70 TaxID=1897634 RepID=UPI000978B5AE|nr:VC0807 family protein [Tersicoccus sp. Bi-70]OMH36884.1 hypothetical protein BGP79_14175 [Tersicoccus sp. Bi-70]